MLSCDNMEEEKLLFVVIVGALVTVEHAYFGRKWKHNEYARRAMGIITVMGCAFGLVLLRVFDLQTWLWIFLAFGLSGTIIITMDLHHEANTRQQLARTEKQRINELTHEQDSR